MREREEYLKRCSDGPYASGEGVCKNLYAGSRIGGQVDGAGDLLSDLYRIGAALLVYGDPLVLRLGRGCHGQHAHSHKQSPKKAK